MKLYIAPKASTDQMYLEVNMGLIPVEIDEEWITERLTSQVWGLSISDFVDDIMNKLKGEQ